MKQRGWSNLTTVIVIIVLLIAGYFVYGQTSDFPKAPKQTVQPSPTTDEIVNWKIYTNTKTNYAISYPNSLSFESSQYDGIGGSVNSDRWKDSSGNFSIYVNSYKEGVNNKLEFNAQTESKENILVAGQKVEKIVGKGISSDTGTLIWIGPIKNKGYNYMLIYSSGSQKADPGDIDLFNQMVSTLKFTQ